MPNKELSYINYNGETYILIDSTADSKYSALSHRHNINDITDLAFDGTYNATTNKVATESTVNNAIAALDISDLGLGKALKFIGFATSSMTDGQTAAPTVDGVTSYSPKVGDVVIDASSDYEYVYTSANKWEQLGSDSSYVPVGTKINYTPAGVISNDGSTVNYTPTGSISTQSFHGTKGEVAVVGTTDGTVSITTATTGTLNYTPTGTISGTLVGQTATISLNGSTSGVSVGDHKYTPAGNITVTTTTNGANYTPGGKVTLSGFPSTIAVAGTPMGTVTITATTATNVAENYTPAGAVTATFSASAQTVNVSGATSGITLNNITPSGSISTATTGTVNYTPAGSITTTFTGSNTEFSGSFKPEGTVSKPNVSVTTSTASVDDITDWDEGIMFSTTVSNEKLIFNDGAVPTLTYTNRSAVVSVTAALASAPVFSANDQTVTVSGTPKGSTSASFSGTGIRLVFTGTSTTPTIKNQGTVTASGPFTPAGTITASFKGTAARLGATFTGSSFSSTGDFPANSLSATFTGSAAKFAFSGSTTTLSHTVQQGTVNVSGNYTPTGTLSGQLVGNGVRIGATFSGKQITSTGSFTPTGTIDTATFSGTGAKLKFTGTATQLTIG